MKAKVPPAGHASRRVVGSRKAALAVPLNSPIERVKASRAIWSAVARAQYDEKFERDKAQIVQSLIFLTNSTRYDDIAVIAGALEFSDYLSFTRLTVRERRELQGRLLRFVKSLGRP
jgi:hypothetical protein